MGEGDRARSAESQRVGAHLQRKRDALRASILAASAGIVRADSASGPLLLGSEDNFGARSAVSLPLNYSQRVRSTAVF
jgi:hypothetical protein